MYVCTAPAIGARGIKAVSRRMWGKWGWGVGEESGKQGGGGWGRGDSS